ncbi:proline dehydrogenase family protein [Acidicapsa acidisoli]|uniref:proline dehydrogenase family protein n=1 Tax=Acidicapsa acidisoli TaxID=1615681 RepID=UPI0021DFB565|nr:proline dehydrogenase family protein [Acidicapsa acidisoli]
MPLLRSAFIALSTNQTLRRFSESSSAGRKLSSRFVAGLEVEDALRTAERLNKQGMTVTLDSLGESVSTEAEAYQAAEIYHRLLDAIAAQHLSANISVKLTQMGLELSPDLAYTIAAGLTEHARATGNFVRIDMEGSHLTQVTLDLVQHLHAREDYRGHIGIVIQAYLYRSEADIQQLIANGIRVRLCKGAYQEQPSVAFPKKTDTDTNYVRLAGILLSSPIYHGLATHDEAMIEAAKSFAANRGIGADHFEFQMLYGVRRDLQRRLVREGYNVRVYVPFGREWYPYFMRRLAERPANVFFLARNLLR